MVSSDWVLYGVLGFIFFVIMGYMLKGWRIMQSGVYHQLLPAQHHDGYTYRNRPLRPFRSGGTLKGKQAREYGKAMFVSSFILFSIWLASVVGIIIF
jgi:hypothetical protein